LLAGTLRPSRGFARKHEGKLTIGCSGKLRSWAQTRLFRYDATEFTPGITEVLTYGTAVRLAD